MGEIEYTRILKKNPRSTFERGNMSSIENYFGLDWSPEIAETLTFWRVLPRVIYIVAGGAASWKLNQMKGGK